MMKGSQPMMGINFQFMALNFVEFKNRRNMMKKRIQRFKT